MKDIQLVIDRNTTERLSNATAEKIENALKELRELQGALGQLYKEATQNKELKKIFLALDTNLDNEIAAWKTIIPIPTPIPPIRTTPIPPIRTTPIPPKVDSELQTYLNSLLIELYKPEKRNYILSLYKNNFKQPSAEKCLDHTAMLLKSLTNNIEVHISKNAMCNGKLREIIYCSICFKDGEQLCINCKQRWAVAKIANEWKLELDE